MSGVHQIDRKHESRFSRPFWFIRNGTANRTERVPIVALIVRINITPILELKAIQMSLTLVITVVRIHVHYRIIQYDSHFAYVVCYHHGNNNAGTDIYTATITATVATDVIARAAGAGGGALSWITINGEKIDCCHFEYPPTQKNDQECMLKIDGDIVYAEFHELTKKGRKDHCRPRPILSALIANMVGAQVI